MPTLPLPHGGGPLDGGDLPVTSSDDVLAEFPDLQRRPSVAPVRDAFTEAFSVGFCEYQRETRRAAAQSDALRATGDYLTLKAYEEFRVARTVGESDEDLRARMLAVPDIVTPQAIVDAVNAILAPHTSKECQLVELELDGWFVHDGTATAWDSFIGVTPRYPDRLYVDDTVENEGDFIENNDPGGALVSYGYSRCFHLRLPDLSVADEEFAFAIDSADEIMPIGDGSDTSSAESDGSDATSVFSGGATAEELYKIIVATVESIKGQGISWSAYVDSSL